MSSGNDFIPHSILATVILDPCLELNAKQRLNEDRIDFCICLTSFSTTCDNGGAQFC